MAEIDLKQKSKDSFAICLHAAKEQQYHIAISRLYYAVYQRICHVLECLLTPAQLSEIRNTHQDTIATFCSVKNCQAYLIHINELKRIRNKADYKSYTNENGKEDWEKCKVMAQLLSDTENFEIFQNL